MDRKQVTYDASAGLTLIEILIVIGVIGILASLVLTAIGHSKSKAYDNSIRSDIGQFRLLAEQAFDDNGGSYRNWETVAPQDDVLALKNDIDKNYGDRNPGSFVISIADSQSQNFCVSAPLRNEPGKHYCVDKSGQFLTVSSPCVEYTNSTPNVCPAI